MVWVESWRYITDIIRDFVEISHVTYKKLDELKVVTQHVKIIRRLDPFETQIEQCVPLRKLALTWWGRGLRRFIFRTKNLKFWI